MDNDTLIFLFFVVVMLICMPILLSPDETTTNDNKEFGFRKFSLLNSKCNGPHQWIYNKQKTILQCKRCGIIAGHNNDRE